MQAETVEDPTLEVKTTAESAQLMIMLTVRLQVLMAMVVEWVEVMAVVAV